MIEEAISTVQEDIVRDLYDMAASHREEITWLMQEFVKHEIDTSVQLDCYEQTKRSQTPNLKAPTTSQQPPTAQNADEEEGNADDDTNTDHGDEEEPSLFDILHDDDEDDMDDDPNPIIKSRP